MKIAKNIIIYMVIVSITLSCSKQEKIVSEKNPIIIIPDTTAEIDDQWMLTHQLLLDNINILGIVSTHYGNRSKINESIECKETNDKIIDLIGRNDIKSLEGISTPLESKQYLDKYADQLYELITSYNGPNKIIIIQSGPATEVANLLLKYPKIESKIKVVTTAFYSRDRGMSYNVNNDLLAWQILLESNVEIIVSINQISKESFMINKEGLYGILDSSNSAITTHLNDITSSWFYNNIKIIKSITGDENYWPIWDQILTAYLLDQCKVESTSRPTLLDNGNFEYNSSNKNQNIYWIVSCDSDKVWKDLIDKL